MTTSRSAQAAEWKFAPPPTLSWGALIVALVIDVGLLTTAGRSVPSPRRGTVRERTATAPAERITFLLPPPPAKRTDAKAPPPGRAVRAPAAANDSSPTQVQPATGTSPDAAPPEARADTAKPARSIDPAIFFAPIAGIVRGQPATRAMILDSLMHDWPAEVARSAKRHPNDTVAGPPALQPRRLPSGAPLPAMTGGGGSLPLPLFSSGPSSEQRRRDSIVDADNRARLKRLLDRARTEKARRDSARDTSKTTTAGGLDSLTYCSCAATRFPDVRHLSLLP